MELFGKNVSSAWFSRRLFELLMACVRSVKYNVRDIRFYTY
jgi:hypothetical protein